MQNVSGNVRDEPRKLSLLLLYVLELTCLSYHSHSSLLRLFSMIINQNAEIYVQFDFFFPPQHCAAVLRFLCKFTAVKFADIARWTLSSKKKKWTRKSFIDFNTKTRNEENSQSREKIAPWQGAEIEKKTTHLNTQSGLSRRIYYMQRRKRGVENEKCWAFSAFMCSLCALSHRLCGNTLLCFIHGMAVNILLHFIAHRVWGKTIFGDFLLRSPSWEIAVNMRKVCAAGELSWVELYVCRINVRKDAGKKEQWKVHKRDEEKASKLHHGSSKENILTFRVCTASEPAGHELFCEALARISWVLSSRSLMTLFI